MKKCIWCWRADRNNEAVDGTFCQECLDECKDCWNETDTIYCKECAEEIRKKLIPAGAPKWDAKLELIEEGDEWKY